MSDLLGYKAIEEQLSDHDDRVREGKAEIRMLASMDNDSTGGFVFFIVLRKGKFYASYTEDQEEQAILSYMDGR